jgi:hypothetical protein
MRVDIFRRMDRIGRHCLIEGKDGKLSGCARVWEDRMLKTQPRLSLVRRSGTTPEVAAVCDLYMRPRANVPNAGIGQYEYFNLFGNALQTEPTKPGGGAE